MQQFVLMHRGRGESERSAAGGFHVGGVRSL